MRWRGTNVSSKSSENSESEETYEPYRELLSDNILDKLTSEDFVILRDQFATLDSAGKGLSADAFHQVLKTVIRHVEMEDSRKLFYKIDGTCKDRVSWLDFLLAREAIKKYRRIADLSLRQDQKSFDPIPTVQRCVSTKDRIVAMKKYRKIPNVIEDRVEGSYIAASKDGYVLWWSPDLQRQCRKLHVALDILNYDQRVKDASLRVKDLVCMPEGRMFALCSEIGRDVMIYSSDPFNFTAIARIRFSKRMQSIDYHPPSSTNESSMLLAAEVKGELFIIYIKSSYYEEVWNLHANRITRPPSFEDIFITNVVAGKREGFSARRIQLFVDGLLLEMRYNFEFPSVISLSYSTKCSVLSVYRLTLNKEFHKKRDVRINTFDTISGGEALSMRFIVAGDVVGAITVWNFFNINQGPLTVLRGHTDSVVHVRTDSQRQMIISVSLDRRIKVWDFTKQSCIQTISFDILPLDDVRYGTAFYDAPQKCFFLFTHSFAFYRPPATLTSNVKKTLRASVCKVFYLDIFDDVVVASQDSRVSAWNVRNGQMSCDFFPAHVTIWNMGVGKPAPIYAASFNDTKRLLATVGSDACVKVWNIYTAHCIQSFQLPRVRDGMYIIAFCSDSIVACGMDGKVREYVNGEEGVEDGCIIYKKRHSDRIVAIDVYNHSTFATASANGEMFVWDKIMKKPSACYKVKDLEDSECEMETLLHGESGLQSTITKMLFLKKRSITSEVATLVTCHQDPWIRFWCMKYPIKLVAAFKPASEPLGSVLCIATDLSNKFLITGHTTGHVRVWLIEDYCNNAKSDYRKETFEEISRFLYVRLLHAIKYGSTKTFFSAIKQHLQQKSFIGSVLTQEPLLLNSFRAHISAVADVAFVDTYELIITCGREGSVRLWYITGYFVGVCGQGMLWDLDVAAETDGVGKNNMPLDVRRIASPMTLKVLNKGRCPGWERVIYFRKRMHFHEYGAQFWTSALTAAKVGYMDLSEDTDFLEFKRNLAYSTRKRLNIPTVERKSLKLGIFRNLEPEETFSESKQKTEVEYKPNAIRKKFTTRRLSKHYYLIRVRTIPDATVILNDLCSMKKFCKYRLYRKEIQTASKQSYAKSKTPIDHEKRRVERNFLKTGMLPQHLIEKYVNAVAAKFSIDPKNVKVILKCTQVRGFRNNRTARKKHGIKRKEAIDKKVTRRMKKKTVSVGVNVTSKVVDKYLKSCRFIFRDTESEENDYIFSPMETYAKTLENFEMEMETEIVRVNAELRKIKEEPVQSETVYTALEECQRQYLNFLEALLEIQWLNFKEDVFSSKYDGVRKDYTDPLTVLRNKTDAVLQKIPLERIEKHSDTSTMVKLWRELAQIGIRANRLIRRPDPVTVNWMEAKVRDYFMVLQDAEIERFTDDSRYDFIKKMSFHGLKSIYQNRKEKKVRKVDAMDVEVDTNEFDSEKTGQSSYMINQMLRDWTTVAVGHHTIHLTEQQFLDFVGKPSAARIVVRALLCAPGIRFCLPRDITKLFDWQSVFEELRAFDETANVADVGYFMADMMSFLKRMYVPTLS